MTGTSLHFDPEILAAFAEGRLKAASRDAVIAHIDGCDECMNDVALVMPTAGAESERKRFGRSTWLMAVAAAIVLVVQKSSKSANVRCTVISRTSTAK